MDNIAEGFERSSRFEFINALGIAKGEAGELKSQLYRALDVKYISKRSLMNYILNQTKSLRWQHL